MITGTRRRGLPGGSVVKNPYVNAGATGAVGLILGSGRSSGGGDVNPLQYSCRDNPTVEESGELQSVESQESDTTEHTRIHQRESSGCNVIECIIKTFKEMGAIPKAQSID